VQCLLCIVVAVNCLTAFVAQGQAFAFISCHCNCASNTCIYYSAMRWLAVQKYLFCHHHHHHHFNLRKLAYKTQPYSMYLECISTLRLIHDFVLIDRSSLQLPGTCNSADTQLVGLFSVHNFCHCSKIVLSTNGLFIYFFCGLLVY